MARKTDAAPLNFGPSLVDQIAEPLAISRSGRGIYERKSHVARLQAARRSVNSFRTSRRSSRRSSTDRVSKAHLVLAPPDTPLLNER
jgi:hypothetical protein